MPTRLSAKGQVTLPDGIREAIGEGDVGEELRLPPETPPGQHMAKWLKTFYENIEPLPEDFLADRCDTPAQERDRT